MKHKKSAIFFVILSVFITTVQAKNFVNGDGFSRSDDGITIGRNGGGLVEMQVVSIFSELPSLMQYCLKAQNYCGLKEAEQKSSRDYLSFIQKNKVQLTYQFDLSKSFEFNSKKSNLILNQNLFYTSQNQGKSYSELVKIVFAAAFYLVREKTQAELNNINDWLAEKDFNLTVNSFTIQMYPLPIKALLIQIENLDLSDELFFEQAVQTDSIKDLLTKVLKTNICKIKSATWDENLLSLEVIYRRNRQNFQGSVLIDPKLSTNDNLYHFDQIRLVNEVEI